MSNPSYIGIGANILPTASGNYTIGSAAVPFSGVVANTITANSITGAANPGQTLISSQYVSGTSFNYTGLETGTVYKMEFAFQLIGADAYLIARVNNDSSAKYNICTTRANAGTIGVDDILNTANPYMCGTFSPNSNGSMTRGYIQFSSDFGNSQYAHLGGQTASSNATNGKPMVCDFSIQYVNGTAFSGITILPSAGSLRGLINLYKIGSI